MKLHYSILKDLIELSTEQKQFTPKELRPILDSLGLEVKNISEASLTNASSNSSNTVFTIETLANRGDHLSALGVARELSARLLTQIKLPQAATELPSSKISYPVFIDTELCHSISFLELTLNNKLELSPEVIQATASEAANSSNNETTQTKHHPIVDLLNYLQLENGQPMHAFDKDKIEGEIRVAVTDKEEEVLALNGKTYKLPIGTIVIRDAKRIISIAGIMGCENTKVTSETKRVIIEAASFDPVAIRKAARKIALVTEASHAFERGSDRDNIQYTLRRLLYMVQGANRDGSAAQPIGSYNNVSVKSEVKKIPVRFKRVKEEANLPRLLNADVIIRLKHLGYSIAGTDKDSEIIVTVPSWRIWDVNNEIDVIEDYICAAGLDKVKLEVPLIEPELPVLNVFETVREKVEPVLIGAGFCEAITKGFYSDTAVKVLNELIPDSSSKHIRLKNSVESSFSAMKMTNVIHLAELVEKNLRFGVLSPKVFEFGRTFVNYIDEKRKPVGDLEYEREVLSLAIAGKWNDSEWGSEQKLQEKLLQFKGVIENIFYSLGVKTNSLDNRSFVVIQNSTKESGTGICYPQVLHPGFSALIKCDSKVTGCFGLIHPEIKTELGLKNDVLYAEFDVATLFELIKHQGYTPKNDLPSIKRDFTLQIPINENAEKVLKTIKNIKNEVTQHLVETSIVDDFKKPEEDFRRVTFRLKFQAQDRSLQHDEVSSDVEKILEALK